MTKKDTHTVQQVQALYDKEVQILKDKNVGKDRKKEALKTLKKYEKFMRDIDFKSLNGKTYKTPRLSWSDDKPMNKTEVLKLIDSVDTPDLIHDQHIDHDEPFDLTGVSVGKQRFVFQELD